MSETRPRVAVVGAGAFGRNHLRVIRESGLAELAGVYDLDPQRRQAAAAEFGCPAYASLDDIAGSATAAIVAVPTTSHKEVACRLMDVGLDVMVEKPIAITTDEARQMVSAASSRGRILQVGHLERFNPAVEALRKIVRRPLFFEIHRLSIFTPRSLDVDVVSDLMIHDLDIVLSLTGAMPEEVRAAGISVLSERVDIANVRLAFPGGVVANLTASRVSTERVRKLRLFQPRQYISVDYARRDCVAISVSEDRQVRIEPQKVEPGEPLARQFESFLNAIDKRTAPVVDGIAAARALDLAQQIVARIEEHASLVTRTLVQQE
ncbi:MAG TPA: Gfo/Idh/MocA family oxidoreductase [Bryobacteraceae bacterium]|nr:Gfo/Idh/MocA family oxidoreductase [Bryobacteraceae bacterium]